MSDRLKKNAGTDDDTALRVECYAGHRADTEPCRLHIGSREVAVTEIGDLLGASGVLSRRLPGYNHRPQQEAMAVAVAVLSVGVVVGAVRRPVGGPVRRPRPCTARRGARRRRVGRHDPAGSRR